MRWRASVPTRTWSSWGHFLTKKSIRKSTTTPLRSLLTTKRSANRALSRASPKSSTSMKIWAWRMKIPMDRNLTMSSETSLKSMTTIFHGTKSMSMTCIDGFQFDIYKSVCFPITFTLMENQITEGRRTTIMLWDFRFGTFCRGGGLRTYIISA